MTHLGGETEEGKGEAGCLCEIEAERWFYSSQKNMSNPLVDRFHSFTKMGELWRCRAVECGTARSCSEWEVGT